MNLKDEVKLRLAFIIARKTFRRNSKVEQPRSKHKQFSEAYHVLQQRAINASLVFTPVGKFIASTASIYYTGKRYNMCDILHNICRSSGLSFDESEKSPSVEYSSVGMEFLDDLTCFPCSVFTQILMYFAKLQK
jgi:hypothetical protein